MVVGFWSFLIYLYNNETICYTWWTVVVNGIIIGIVMDIKAFLEGLGFLDKIAANFNKIDRNYLGFLWNYDFIEIILGLSICNLSIVLTNKMSEGSDPTRGRMVFTCNRVPTKTVGMGIEMEIPV